MALRSHTVYHRDGSVWGRGKMNGKVPDGKWTWFRTNGTKMRSGSFKHGKQVGTWTTYDQQGNVYKVTKMKS